MDFIGMKYLKYKIKKQIKAGVCHKRASLSYLFADSIIEGRIPIIHKSHLWTMMDTQPQFLSNYLIGDYYKIQNKFVYEDEIQNDDDVLIKSFDHDDFWEFDLNKDLIELTSKIHGIGMKSCIPIWEPSNFIKRIGEEILSTLTRPIVGIHLRKPSSRETWWNNSPGIKDFLEDMKIESLVSKIKKFNWNNVFIGCSTNVENRDENIKMITDYDYIFENNFYKFLVEQYIIDNSDISIRTFSDSTIHFKKNSVGENYYLFNNSMHSHLDHDENWPIRGDLFKQNYEEIK